MACFLPGHFPRSLIAIGLSVAPHSATARNKASEELENTPAVGPRHTVHGDAEVSVPAGHLGVTEFRFCDRWQEPGQEWAMMAHLALSDEGDS